MSQTIRRIELDQRVIILAGTAHISQESIEEVRGLIENERPQRVCVEIDEGRWRSMNEGRSWESLDVTKVLRGGRGFLLLANLALSGFQRRMGTEVGVKPGEEMLAAVRTAESLGIPYSFCDRDVQVTLKRAWAMSGLWNRAKLLAALMESSFFSEKLNAEQIEKLKEQNELEQMMAELAAFLPSVKEVLIDERDRFLASRIFQATEPSVVAVVGAGHLDGIESWLRRLAAGEVSPETADIESTPPKGILGKVASWAIPILIVGLIALGFLRSGTQASLHLLVRWILLNGSLAALGSALCMAHPLTIVVSFVMAPFATLNPAVGVGLFAGLAEAYLRKPRVSDLERLAEDVGSLKGFYRNRVTHILLVFFLSSLGGAIGNFITLPVLAAGALHK
ncbi:MAG TPA: TraB/GumN family protein [Rectinemataceae bacterium]|nr:TraB/GumN family protein [Rectinemataceae bacterium]